MELIKALIICALMSTVIIFIMYKVDLSSDRSKFGRGEITKEQYCSNYKFVHLRDIPLVCINQIN